MGRAIATLALQDSVFTIGAALEASGHEAIGRDYGTVLGASKPLSVKVGDDVAAALKQGDVMIEFTLPDVTLAHVQAAQQLRKPMVIGTTGLSDAQRATLNTAAKTIPIVFSANMSVGVNVLFDLVRTAAQRLGPSFEVSMVEKHHQHKKDKPSGTAKTLQGIILEARTRSSVPLREVPCESIREGEIVGDHTVTFSNAFERVELTHHAERRDVFAAGALKAAAFIVTQRPGLYDMSDVLK